MDVGQSIQGSVCLLWFAFMKQTLVGSLGVLCIWWLQSFLYGSMHGVLLKWKKGKFFNATSTIHRSWDPAVASISSWSCSNKPYFEMSSPSSTKAPTLTYIGNRFIISSGIKCPKETTNPKWKLSVGKFGQLWSCNCSFSANFVTGLTLLLSDVTTSSFRINFLWFLK